MGKTTIEWTDASWNPIVGCTEVSPGCANCYAERLAATRLKNTPAYRGLALLRKDMEFPRWTGQVRFLPERLEEPLHWKTPQRIFVCDMGDLFHEDVQEEWLDRIYAVMVDCEHRHTFQVLTKRADRMRHYFSNLTADRVRKHLRGPGTLAWPLRNVWLGVSVENQHFAEERIPPLLETPAALRWISAEPLLGSIEIMRYLQREHPGAFPGQNGRVLDWVVCGGESGPNARAMHPNWPRWLRDQCRGTGVPFFFKQWGEWVDPQQSICALHTSGAHDYVADGTEHSRGCPNAKQFVIKAGKKNAGRLLDGCEWNEFPRLTLERTA